MEIYFVQCYFVQLICTINYYYTILIVIFLFLIFQGKGKIEEIAFNSFSLDEQLIKLIFACFGATQGNALVDSYFTQEIQT